MRCGRCFGEVEIVLFRWGSESIRVDGRDFKENIERVENFDDIFVDIGGKVGRAPDEGPVLAGQEASFDHGCFEGDHGGHGQHDEARIEDDHVAKALGLGFGEADDVTEVVEEANGSDQGSGGQRVRIRFGRDAALGCDGLHVAPAADGRDADGAGQRQFSFEEHV